MAKTFRISNGDFHINSALGELETIEGTRKTAQEMAESLLTVFDPEREFGSELATGFYGTVYDTMNIAGGVASTHMYNAIYRLQALQLLDDAVTADERIAEVEGIQSITEPDSTEILVIIKAKTDSHLDIEQIMQINDNLTQLNQVSPFKE